MQTKNDNPKFNPEALSFINKQLINELAKAKTELERNLESQIQDFNQKLDKHHHINVYGGRVGTATSPDLLPYKWIIVNYNNESTNETRNYMLALNQDLLDLKTGNPHSCFGKLQFWRGLKGIVEVGGSPNDAPVKLVTNEVSKDRSPEKYYELHYCAHKAFPTALVRSSRNGNDSPWDLSIAVGELESFKSVELDLASPGYSPSEAAKLFLRLIELDIQTRTEK